MGLAVGGRALEALLFQIKEDEADLIPVGFRQGPGNFQQGHHAGGVDIGVMDIGRTVSDQVQKDQNGQKEQNTGKNIPRLHQESGTQAQAEAEKERNQKLYPGPQRIAGGAHVGNANGGRGIIVGGDQIIRYIGRAKNKVLPIPATLFRMHFIAQVPDLGLHIGPEGILLSGSFPDGIQLQDVQRFIDHRLLSSLYLSFVYPDSSGDSSRKPPPKDQPLASTQFMNASMTVSLDISFGTVIQPPISISFSSIVNLKNKNALYPHRIEGAISTVPPLIRQNSHENCPHSVQQHFPLYRAVPVLPYCDFGKATPGGIWAAFPTALHQPAALWRKRNRLLVPINVLLLRCDNPNKRYRFCQDSWDKNLGILTKTGCQLLVTLGFPSCHAMQKNIRMSISLVTESTK